MVNIHPTISYNIIVDPVNQMHAHKKLSSEAFSHSSVLPWENADLNVWPTTQYVHVCSMMLAMSLVTLPHQHCPLWFAGSQLTLCPFLHGIILVHFSKAPYSKDQWLHGRARKPQRTGTSFFFFFLGSVFAKGTLVKIIWLQFHLTFFLACFL